MKFVRFLFNFCWSLIAFCAVSIPINFLIGNKLFCDSLFFYPIGLSFGFPPFFYFFLVEHHYILHGFTKYLLLNFFIILTMAFIINRLDISKKVFSFILGISLLVMIFYLISFLYCYIYW